MRSSSFASLSNLSRFGRALTLTITFLTLLGGSFARGQTAKGVVVGRVADSGGAVLQGARVDLQPSGALTFTNGSGEFTFTSVNPGAYVLKVSAIGFADSSTDVKVTSGEPLRANITLKVASQNEEVTVTAERVHGEAEAINRERASDNILQVLPVEVITSLPNTNIADALGRLPSVTLERDEGEGKYVQIRGTDPSLSNVTVNGIEVPSPEGGVRQIKLDTIPANLVESVEINKTLAANQEAGGIGGSVNLVTKTAEEKPTLYLNGIGGYTPIIGGRPLYEMDGTVGKRFGSSKRLGILVGGSYDWNGRGIDDVEPGPTVSQCNASGCDGPAQAGAQFFPTYGGIDIREYRYYRTRYGFAGSVDYKLGELSGLYVRTIYSHFNNYGDRWVYSPSFGSFAGPNATTNNGDGSISFNSQIRRPLDVIGSLEAGGKHVFSHWWLAYDVSVSRSAEEDHGYANANFAPLSNSPLNAIPFSLDTSDPYRPKILPQGGVNIYDPTQYYLSGSGIIDVSRNYSPQLNLQTGFSAARDYHLGSHFATFEFGAKFRNAHKFEDNIDNYYDGVDPSTLADPSVLQMSNFLDSFTNSGYYDKSYTLGPVTNFGKIQSFFNANQASLFPFDLVQTQLNTLPNNYDLTERVSAGYIMNTVDIGRFRVQTGLRFEATNEGLQGNNVTLDPNTGALTSVIPVNTNNSYVDPLPSVQVRYRLPHDASLRAAYGRGIARPNFSDLPPFLTHNGPNQEIDIGNPNLKPTHANNYDLLYEQYLKPLGLLQAGFFYKQLSDPIYEGVKSPITTDVYGSFFNGGNLVQPINGKSAHLYGFEVAYQQHLTFLPGPLAGLGISANYSYTNSQTDGVPNRSDKPALLRQAPNTFNISPTYDRGRLSVRMGISYNGANIFQYNYSDLNPDGTPNPQPLGKKGPNGDVYLYSHTQVDAQAAFRMYRGLQLIVSGLNLTNEVFGFYQGSPIYPIQREYYKPSYSFGLRYTLSNEPK